MRPHDATEWPIDELVTPAGGSASSTAFSHDAVGHHTTQGTLRTAGFFDDDVHERLLDDGFATFTGAARRLNGGADGVGTTTYG